MLQKHTKGLKGIYDWFTGRLENNMLTITEVKEGFHPGSMLLLCVLIVIMVYPHLNVQLNCYFTTLDHF